MSNSDKNKSSDGTEEKLLKAALDLFARNGFDGTSTREICKNAGVNISLIPYYFRSKDGLYQAVIKMIASIALENMLPVLKKVNNIEQNTREENLLLLHEIIERFIDFALNIELPQSIGLLIVREQIEPTPAFEILYNIVMKDVYGSIRKLIASILNKDESDPEITYRTSTVIGQIMAFKMGRRVTLRSLKKEEYTMDDIQGIKRVIRDNIDAVMKNAGDI